jgi:hypothetical protein
MFVSPIKFQAKVHQGRLMNLSIDERQRFYKLSVCYNLGLLQAFGLLQA